MIFSVKTTLVLITRDLVVRADFSAGRAPRLLQLAQRRRPETDDPAVLLSAAAATDGSKPGRVFVLSTDFWTRTLELDGATSRGMTDADLLRALCFEAEPFSGVSAFEAAASAKPAGGDEVRRFWLTEVSAAVRDQYDEAVRQEGGRLAGLCHPAGLPRPLSDGRATGGRRRIEFWPGATFRGAYQGAAATKIRVDDVRASMEAAAEAWRSESGSAEVEEVLVVGEGREGGLPAGCAARSLADEAVLTEWLTRWCEELVSDAPQAPVVGVAARPLADQTRAGMAVGLAALVALLFYFHDQWVEGRLAEIAKAKAVLEAPGKELDKLNKQAVKLDADLAKIRDAAGKLQVSIERCEEVFATQKKRLPALLDCLTRTPREGWVLLKIDGGGDELKLHGATLHPQRINELAKELAVELLPLGWSVQPPKQRSEETTHAAPWKFELRLVDVATAVPAPPPPPRTTSRERTASDAR